MNKNNDDFPIRSTCTGRFNHHGPHNQERIYMEKYGVQVDKKKLDDTKKGLGEKTAGVDDPDVNVPKDPDKGTEPFEKRPEDE